MAYTMEDPKFMGQAFGGEMIPRDATASPDPYENYNVADAYKKSNFYDNSMQSQGYLDFLEDARTNFMNREMQQDVKSVAFNDARNKIYSAYDTFNPITNQAEQEAYMTQNPATQIGIGNVRKYDDGFFPVGGYEPTVGDPSMNTSEGIGTQQGTDTTDIFGAGNNPINNPIAPMPSPITPPPTMNSSHSHDNLLAGIGKLFEQYFPQRGGTSTPSATQPVFDAVGNSAPPQVFGNMITPFGRQG